MRNRNGSFFFGLAIGVVSGLTAGSIGVAHSATGKKAWERFGGMFQAGYIAGFIDCVRLAKGMDARGYIATSYLLPDSAKPSDYQVWINEEYKKPEAANRTLPQMLVLAGHAMEVKLRRDQATGGIQPQQSRKTIDDRRKAATEGAPPKDGTGASPAADAAKEGASAPRVGEAAEEGEPSRAAKRDATPAPSSGPPPTAEAAPAQ